MEAGKALDTFTTTFNAKATASRPAWTWPSRPRASKASSAAASLSKPSFKFATGSSAAKGRCCQRTADDDHPEKGESYTAADIQALLEKATTGTASGCGGI